MVFVNSKRSQSNNHLTNVSSPNVIVKTVDTLSRNLVMTETHVLSTLAILQLEDVNMSERDVMITINVPVTLVLMENVKTLQSLVMTIIHVLLTLAIQLKDVKTNQNTTSDD
jgi:hypothetical protein